MTTGGLSAHPILYGTLPVFINGILIHALGVGLPAAWFARG